MLEELFKPFGCTISVRCLDQAMFYTYDIKCSNEGIDTILNWNPLEKLEQILKPIIYKLISVLSNGAEFDLRTVYDENKLKEFIDTYYITLTPEEKLDSVLEYLNKLTSFDGESIELEKPQGIDIPKMYFNHYKEWEYYLESAISQGYINTYTDFNGEYTTQYYNLAVSGLTRLIKIYERKTSRFCFVAMAFTNEMDEIYKGAIEPAIINCGFEPYIVNKINVESDKTINDAILAGIKKARFTIADFTGHRGGVYFEAGYALGRGQNVIYTCKEDEMSKAHFDVRNYQHIVWTDTVDLKKKLIDKIEAFILE